MASEKSATIRTASYMRKDHGAEPTDDCEYLHMYRAIDKEEI